MKKGCEWSFESGGKPHTAKVVHEWMTGEKEFFVDGERVHHVPGGLAESASFGGTYPFEAGGVRGEFRLKAVGQANFYALHVNGKKIPGKDFAEVNWPLLIISLAALGVFAFYMMAQNP